VSKRIILTTIAIFIVFNVHAQQARITEVKGNVEIKSSRDWEAASVGDIIGKSMSISTGVRSSAVVAVGSSTITISPLSIVTLEELLRGENSEETTLFLRSGRLRADITPPGSTEVEFTVRSPTTTASVRGTSFTFNGRRLQVHSGSVSLINNISLQKVVVNRNKNTYFDPDNNGRIKPVNETDTDIFNLVLPELADTGSGGDSTSLPVSSSGANIIPEWQ
jgi:hypothetical protein